MVSKITDQNVRNVFNALEKHKLMIEEKFHQMEVDHERIKGKLTSVETDITLGNVVGKRSTSKLLGAGRNSVNHGGATPGVKTAHL